MTTLRYIGVGDGKYMLNTSTTLDDNALDTLYAAQGVTNPSLRTPNWYQLNTMAAGVKDSLIGKLASEEVTDNG